MCRCLPHSILPPFYSGAMPLKYLSSLILILLIATTTHAQLGMQLGYNSATFQLENNDQYVGNEAISGISFGAFYRTQGRYVAIQPTLLYTQKGARNSGLSITRLRKYEFLRTRLNYLEVSVPVLGRVPLYKQEWWLAAGAGPYGALLKRARAIGKEYIAGGKLVEDYSIGDTNKDHFQKWDAGISFSGSITYFHMALGVSYDLGLMNISPRASQSIKNRNLSVHLMLLL